MQGDKEEQLLIKRFKELGSTAYYKGILTYTDFLNLNEISIFHSIKKDLGKLLYESYGGYEGAERQIFFLKGNDIELNYDEYISCVLIEPLNKRFSDKLSHRDFLGSILGLGLERTKIGDILVRDNEAYCFCFTNISDFIIDNLNKVKHTSVSCSIADTKANHFTPNFIEISGTISSNRLDAIISVALKTSRNKVLNLISSGKIFINGKEVLSNSHTLKEEDIFSIRGHGKFIYKGEKGLSRKGRLRILLLKYN
ncbi:MAG TPA: RNA-binding protein [Clostridiales bacterium]|nr:RNA-binding protein [Clostridiales bacterium]